MKIRQKHRLVSPPRLPSQETSQKPEPVATPNSRVTPQERKDGFVTTALKAFAGVAGLTGGAAQAQEVAVTTVESDTFQNFHSLPDLSHETFLFSPGYTVDFKPFDIDIDPKWRDGGPALRYRADLFNTNVYQRFSDRGGTTVRGVTAHLSGYGYLGEEPEVALGYGAFRSHQRPLGEAYQLRFDQRATMTHLLHSDYPGAYFDLGFRQELRGGQFSFFDRDFSFYGEAQQNLRYDFRSDETTGDYKIFAGARTDFDVRILGQRGNVQLTVGPRIDGSFFGGGPELKLGTEVRFRRR